MKKPPASQPAEFDHDTELPEGWVLSTVGEVFSDIRNGTTAGQNKEHNGLPVSRIESIQQSRFDLNRVGHIHHAPPELVKTFRYQPGDIAFNHINSYEHVGKTALYEGTPPLFIHGMNLLRLRLGHLYLQPRYVHVWMQTDVFRNEVRSRVGHAVNQVSINQGNLSEVPLYIAPLPEQQRIVAAVEKLLAKLSDARDHLAKVPKILKAFRQSVFAAACSGRLTDDWRESHNAPAWDSVVIEDVIVAKPRNGLSVKAVNYKTDVRSLTLTATTSGRFESGHFKYLDVDIPPESHLWLKRGDILLQRGNTAEYVGIAALYDGEDDEYIYPDLMIKIRPKEGVLSEYLWIALSAPKARQYFRENATGSQGSMPKINQTIVENAPIHIPSPGEQHEIVRRVEALFKLADQIEKRVEAATKRADKLTQSILAKAFRGELVSTEAELARKEGRTYETADELLACIRSEREKSAATKTTAANRKSRPNPTGKG